MTLPIDLDVGVAAAGAEVLRFEDLYRSTFRPLSDALRLAGAGASADDLAQEALARCYERWRRVQLMANPRGYAYTIAFRLLRRRVRRTPAADLARHVPGVDGEVATRTAVAAALRAMPPRQRAVAVLCIVEGWEPTEAAAALRMSASTARFHLHAARVSLRASLTR